MRFLFFEGFEDGMEQITEGYPVLKEMEKSLDIKDKGVNLCDLKEVYIHHSDQCEVLKCVCIDGCFNDCEIKPKKRMKKVLKVLKKYNVLDKGYTSIRFDLYHNGSTTVDFSLVVQYELDVDCLVDIMKEIMLNMEYDYIITRFKDRYDFWSEDYTWKVTENVFGSTVPNDRWDGKWVEDESTPVLFGDVLDHIVCTMEYDQCGHYEILFVRDGEIIKKF